eukprot:2785841-Rhodomonas_salina.1
MVYPLLKCNTKRGREVCRQLNLVNTEKCQKCSCIPKGWTCRGCQRGPECDVRVMTESGTPSLACQGCDTRGIKGERCDTCGKFFHARWDWKAAAEEGREQNGGQQEDVKIAEMLSVAHEFTQVWWVGQPQHPRGRKNMVTSYTTASEITVPCQTLDAVTAAFERRKERSDVELLALANDDYHSSLGKLTKCIHDAGIMETSFKEIGAFVSARRNLREPLEFFCELRGFRKRLQQRAQKPALAVVYYAGHSVQVGDDLFLVPAYIDTAVCRDYQDIEEAPDMLCFPLSRLLNTIKNVCPLLIVIDSCRDFLTPVENGNVRGLNVARDMHNCDIWYSTTKGDVAADSTRFVDILVKQLFTPGNDLGTAFQAMGRELRETSEVRGVDQTPVKAEGCNLDQQLVLVRKRKRYILCVVSSNDAKADMKKALASARMSGDEWEVRFRVFGAASEGGVDEPLCTSIECMIKELREQIRDRSIKEDGRVECIFVGLPLSSYESAGPLLCLDIPYIVCFRLLPVPQQETSKGFWSFELSAQPKSAPVESAQPNSISILALMGKFLERVTSPGASTASYGKSYTASVDATVGDFPEFETSFTPVLMWNDTQQLDPSWIEQHKVMGIALGSLNGALCQLFPPADPAQLFAKALELEDASIRMAEFKRSWTASARQDSELLIAAMDLINKPWEMPGGSQRLSEFARLGGCQCTRKIRHEVVSKVLAETEKELRFTGKDVGVHKCILLTRLLQSSALNPDNTTAKAWCSNCANPPEPDDSRKPLPGALEKRVIAAAKTLQSDEDSEASTVELDDSVSSDDEASVAVMNRRDVDKAAASMRALQDGFLRVACEGNFERVREKLRGVASKLPEDAGEGFTQELHAAHNEIEVLKVINKWLLEGCMVLEGSATTSSHVSVVRMSGLVLRLLLELVRTSPTFRTFLTNEGFTHIAVVGATCVSGMRVRDGSFFANVAEEASLQISQVMERETEAGAASLLPAETETSPQKNGKDEDDESGWEAGNFSDDESNGQSHFPVSRHHKQRCRVENVIDCPPELDPYCHI